MLSLLRQVRVLTNSGHRTYYKQPANEPVRLFEPGSEDRTKLVDMLKKMKEETPEIPLMIGGEPVKTGNIRDQLCPFDHSKVVARFHLADAAVVQSAIDAALLARKNWSEMDMRKRADIYDKAADLIAGKYRFEVLASTILGQGKNFHQAEIDSTCELIDFYRFNAYNARLMIKQQPEDTSTVNNYMIYRGLEGFVAAIPPFNFTAIGGCLAGAPSIMGNVVLWKPAKTATLSNWIVYKILLEAGLPRDVINFIPSVSSEFGDTITQSPHLAGISFTGSYDVFANLWHSVGTNIRNYRTFPRLLGECGGKNFHFVHNSADVKTVVTSTIRAAFEYSGQKCSALSRMYIPRSLEKEIMQGLKEIHKQIKLGRGDDPTAFMSAVIDKASFDNIKSYLDYSKANVKIVAGGGCDDTVGYFVEPTIVEVDDPLDKMMVEEIFGPVLAVYVYEDDEVTKALDLVDQSTVFSLTGAIFCQDKEFLAVANRHLRESTGNYYINDKSTGSIVGQQPFSGGRQSGTNDKTGTPSYLSKWTSMQAVKHTKVPLRDWRYPHMDVD